MAAQLSGFIRSEMTAFSNRLLPSEFVLKSQFFRDPDFIHLTHCIIIFEQNKVKTSRTTLIEAIWQHYLSMNMA